MSKFEDFMVDIETTGLRPDRNAILQIGVVPFNLETQEVSDKQLDLVLTVPGWRDWDPNTWAWWMKRPYELQCKVMGGKVPPFVALELYRDFVRSFEPEQPRLWALNAHFDASFLASYFRDFGLDNPIGYRYVRDIRNFWEGLTFPQKKDLPQLTSDDILHDAIADARFQVKLLFSAINSLK